MEEQQRILAQLRDARIAQVTLAHAEVEIFFQVRALFAEVFDGEQVFPLATAGGGMESVSRKTTNWTRLEKSQCGR